MLSDWIRKWYIGVLRPLLEFVAGLGITPNMLTITSLFIVVIAGILFASELTKFAVWVLFFGVILDGIDGALARVNNSTSQLGEFLDSICDHYGDFAIYLGLLWSSLASSAHTDATLLFTAMFGSLIGSQVRSRAGMVGIGTKNIGVFTRLERMIILIGGIFLGKLTIALWLLAVFNNLSALQRVIYTIRASQQNRATVHSGALASSETDEQLQH